jgi:hypothetical protein
MRKKVLEYDGQKYTISPLTLSQVDEFIAAIPASAEATPEAISKRNKELQTRAHQVVAWGLDNALEKSAKLEESERWTPARVYDEIDLQTFTELQTEILVFSGLGRKQLEEGEAKAATIN